MPHLFDSLTGGAVCDGEAEALGTLHHGHRQQLCSRRSAPLDSCRTRGGHGHVVIVGRERRGRARGGGRQGGAVQVRVSGVGGPGLGQRLAGQLGAQRQVLQVGVVAAATVHHQGAVLQSDGRQGGAGGRVGVLRVKGQRVASTQHQGDALADGHRLEELDHVGVCGAQHADVVDVDDDVTCGGRTAAASQPLLTFQGHFRQKHTRPTCRTTLQVISTQISVLALNRRG